MLLDPAELRQNYDLGELNEADTDADPIKQFQVWFDQAVAADLMEPNAMTLATADSSGRPSARMVLMKAVDARGLSFFTNFESRKGQELDRNPHCSLLFWWDRIHRQVRIEGTVERLPDTESDTYYASRPLGSRIGAAASPQSQVIESREWLADRFKLLEDRHPSDIRRPDNWGGYLVRPTRFEFWQGRPSRLHDRLAYEKHADGWQLSRLAP